MDDTEEIEPIELQPGHWQTVINEMKAYIVDLQHDLEIHAFEKDFDKAYETALLIRETKNHIDSFAMSRDEKKLRERLFND